MPSWSVHRIMASCKSKSTILKGCVFFIPGSPVEWDEESREVFETSIRELGGGLSRKSEIYNHIIVDEALWTARKLEKMIEHRETPKRVVLSYEWVGKCKAAGKYLGEAHSWAGHCIAEPGEGMKKWKGYAEEMEILEMAKYGVPPRLAAVASGAAAGESGAGRVMVPSFRGANVQSQSQREAAGSERKFVEPEYDLGPQSGQRGGNKRIRPSIVDPNVLRTSTTQPASTSTPPPPAATTIPFGPPKRRWHTPSSKPQPPLNTDTNATNSAKTARRAADPRLVALKRQRDSLAMPPPPIPVRALNRSVHPRLAGPPSPRSAADESARRIRATGPSPEPHSRGRAKVPRVEKEKKEDPQLPLMFLHPPSPPTTPPRQTVPLRRSTGGLSA